MSKLKYFAVLWGPDAGSALDVYPEEILRHAASLRKQGANVSGPFETEEEALAVVREALSRNRAHRMSGST